MTYRVITVSREFGSGGRSVAKELAKRLQINYYDRELVNELAKRSGFGTQFIEEHGDYVASSHSWLFDFSYMGVGSGRSVSDELYLCQRTLIQELAEQEPCVIVGRCADYILRDRTDVLRVFIHASNAFRQERIVTMYGERDEEPSKRLRDSDKRRQAYYKYYTDRNWGEAKNYHICLDTSVIGIDESAALLEGLIHHSS